MRRIAIINQKGGVGKTTTTVNLGAALAIQGRRVVVVDMDAQANLSLALGVEAASSTPTSYSVLTSTATFGAALRATAVPNLRLLPANLDLSGAELELASAMGREFVLRDAMKEWDDAERTKTKRAPADYVLFDCPPSLGLLSINALAAAGEVLITLQTEFLALQGMSKLVGVVQLLKKRLNPELRVTGIVPCLYDSRLRLAREVLGEIRTYFKSQVLPHPIRSNVKLAEAPSFGATIFEYAPDSNGALDYMRLASEIIAREHEDKDLAGLAPFDEKARLPPKPGEPVKSVRPPPPRRAKLATEIKPPLASAPVAATNPAVVAQAATTPAPTPDKHASPTAVNKKSTAHDPSSSHAEVITKPAAPKTSKSHAESNGVQVPAESTQSPSKTDVSQKSSPRGAAPPIPPAHAATVSTRKQKQDSKSAHAEPAPVRERADTTRSASAPRSELRVMSADDAPPLPPDAFEILSILPTDP